MTNSLTSLQHGCAVIKKTVKTLSEKPGVYRMFNKNSDVLYVGKAKNLKKRVISYTQIDKLSNRLRRMVAETTYMEIVTTHNEVEALLLESNLIKKLQPPYNILLKDDKSFPYIVITEDHMYPRLLKHRGPQTIKGTYFGPFASIGAVEECLTLLQKGFLIRNCTDSFFSARTRPCLQYHIKRCSAPCVEKINSSDYSQLVQQAKDFLSGKSDAIQKVLSKKMHEASEALNYEEAAIYRDRLNLIQRLQTHQRVNVSGLKDADVIALAEKESHTCVQIFFFRQGQNFGTESFFLAHTEESLLDEKLAAFITQFYEERAPASTVLLSHYPDDLSLIEKALSEKYNKTICFEIPTRGKKKDVLTHALNNAGDALERRFIETATFYRLLDDIAQLFNLPHRPNRIEVYDNSHLQGTNPYGVMIVADEHGFNKKAYRKFAIKSPAPEQGGDDYAMMREVLRRRFNHKNDAEWTLPELMLIDGGQGQLNVVLDVMSDLGIDGVTVVGIAKGPDRNAGRERFFMKDRSDFILDARSSTLHFLQRLRDEAHRFAIGAHRQGRQKSQLKSRLDNIPAIGPKRKKALLHHFGSVQNIASASLQDLQNVQGINKSVAKIIYQYFHER